MIENSVELKVAARQLQILEHALRALRDQLASEQPWLLGVTEKAYLQRIGLLAADIAGYLPSHPAEISLLLPPLEQSVLPADIENALADSVSRSVVTGASAT